MTRPGFEPGSPTCEAGALTTRPPLWCSNDRSELHTIVELIYQLAVTAVSGLRGSEAGDARTLLIAAKGMRYQIPLSFSDWTKTLLFYLSVG